MENKRDQGYGEENSPNQRLQTNRELALEWWSKLSEQEKVKFHNKSWTPTSKEVENIYVKEMKRIKELDYVVSKFPPLIGNPSTGVNQKQFTQFSEELFLKYINKFSNEDKLKALKVLSLNLEIIIPDLIIMDNGWECKNSPSGYCDYNQADGSYDEESCRYCHEPEERK